MVPRPCEQICTSVLPTTGEVGTHQASSQIGSMSAGKERVNSTNEATEVRMWEGGPLRQMATSKVGGAFIPYAKTINCCHFAGRYVCDGCQQPCTGGSLQNAGKMSGIRLSGWLCDLCSRGQQRKSRTPEQRQAAIDRLAAARRDRAIVRIQEKEEVEVCNCSTAVTADVNPVQEVYGIM